MDKLGKGKLVALVVLFSVSVVGASALFAGIPFTWQLFIIPVFAGILGSIPLWWLIQHNNPSANKGKPTQRQAQQELIAALHRQLAAIQLENENLEQALDQSKEDVFQALQARTSFLNNIGHELRTPLSIILGYTDIMLQKAKHEDDEQLVMLAQKTKLYAKGLSATINDVLQMSEIESGKVGFLLEAFGIETVIDQTVIQNQAYLDVNQNDFMVIVSPDIGTMVADRDKIRSILGNLLSNAAKFTKNGSITLSANQSVIDDQTWIIFQVTDTGVGISEEQQADIFQPFLQGYNSFTKEYGGVGLGLAISKRLVEMMNGRLWVESAGKGEGATFYFSLPVAKDMPEEAEA